MAQRALLLFKKVILFNLIILCYNCNKKTKEESKLPSSLVVETNAILRDTILFKNKQLNLENGSYHFNKKTYTGYIKHIDTFASVITIGSFLNGKQHGLTTTRFLDGKLKDCRSYKEGKAYGRHYGFWKNGNQKYDFIYLNDKREGIQKQWYESGSKYAFLTFKDDREEGMQKAWRENGKPYINYYAKEGFRYGLQKSSLCYTLRNGIINTATK
jgi:antitoxin component YwqK of YwqJK toxin-antitoxin module